jgi:hypothetical protein
LFWPSHAPTAQAPGTARCAKELAALDEQLLQKTNASLRSSDVAGSQRWLIAWDRRFVALSGGCGALEGARTDLRELRAGVGSLLENYRDGPSQAHQRLRRILDAHAGGLPATYVQPREAPEPSD